MSPTPDPLAAPTLVAQFVTALIGGAVGGMLTTGFKWVEQRAERRRRRRAVATALLNDLRQLELDARELSKADYAAHIASLPATRAGQSFRRIIGTDDLMLFGPDAVSRLLYLASLVTAIEDYGAMYQKSTGADRPKLNVGVRAKAWIIAKNVGVTKRALEREGGTAPPSEPLDIVQGFELPALGAPAFTEWAVPPMQPSPPMWVDAAGRPGPKEMQAPSGDQDR